MADAEVPPTFTCTHDQRNQESLRQTNLSKMSVFLNCEERKSVKNTKAVTLPEDQHLVECSGGNFVL